MKKEIKILIEDSEPIENYIKFLEKRFKLNILTFTDYKTRSSSIKFKNIDLIIFTGGEDINPNYYNEKLGKYTTVNNKRDELCQYISNTFYTTPKLGIGRGAQLLCVLAGGSLIQYVNNHKKPHKITCIKTRSDYIMSSRHHQMMYPYDIPENKYQLIACSKQFKSTRYLNGNNKEMVLPLNFLEPEIIFFKTLNGLSIQGHPEFINSNEFTIEYCLDKIEIFLNKNVKKEEQKIKSYKYIYNNEEFSV